MAHTLKTLTKNLLSKKTFDQVSYYGTLCGSIQRHTTTLDQLKGNPAKYMALPIQVEKQYYLYLGCVWSFSIVTESAHGYQIGEIIKAGWQKVENK